MTLPQVTAPLAKASEAIARAFHLAESGTPGPVAVILAQAQAAIGDLAKLRAVRIGGYVNSTPDFANVPQVVNGASDLFAAVLGDNGKHARFAVGVAQLPLDAAVEVEGIFEILP